MRLGRLSILALALVTATGAVADAETLKCQRTVAKGSAQYFQAITKATAKCTGTVVKTGAGTCPDAAMTAAVAKADAKLASVVAKGCGGKDRVCNGDTVDEDLPAAIGWPSVCPNVATELCNEPITTCADVTTCLRCLGTEIADATNGLAFDALALPGGDDTITKCQYAIGKAQAGYAAAVSKALAKCWRARMTGKHTNACEPPALGDDKYLAAIAKADAKRTSTIAKACGGADRALGGGDDLTPAAIGFAASCPSSAVPSGPACGGPITDLTSIVACLDCVSDAALACTDRAAVPQLSPYPPECAACFAPPLTGLCPTTVALAVRGHLTDIDLGWNGIAHDSTLPSNSGLTLAVTGCDGTNHPTCGACDLAGPITGAGGTSDVSHRCATHTQEVCTTDADCSGGDPCVFFFGPPQGISASGIPFCVLNEIAAPVSGTLDLTTGASAAALSLRPRFHVTGTVAQPCPTCVAGSCDGGARDGEACTAQGTGQRGPVSLDCPPYPGALAGAPLLDFPLSTDVQSRSVTPDSPNCRQTGFTSFKCLCDTCNTGDVTGCFSNADCPASGGAPGICGGRRCIGGTEDGKPCRQCIGGANHGAGCANASACPGGSCPLGCGGECNGGPNADAPCTTNSECPGSTCALGLCNRPGEATQPNACNDDTATPGVLDCAPTVGGEGVCTQGPVDRICSADRSEHCDVDTDCIPVGAGGSCDDCTTANQFCISRQRECFPDNGAIGSPVLAVGAPSVPCDGVARPTLAGLACMPPVGAAFANAFYGLPGLSRLRLPVELAP